MSKSLRAVLDVLPDGVLGERDGFVVYSNRALRRSLGYKSDRELFWRGTDDLIHPSERAGARAWLEQDPAERAASLEVRMVRRTGELVPILDEFARPAIGMYAVYPPGRLVSRRVRVFSDALRAYFRDRVV